MAVIDGVITDENKALYLQLAKDQKRSDEMRDEEIDGADWQDGYDTMVSVCRVQHCEAEHLAKENARLRKTLREIGVRGTIITGGDCGVLRDHARKALGLETLDT